MGFAEWVIEKAQSSPRRIVLPESADERVLKDAREIQAKNMAGHVVGDQQQLGNLKSLASPRIQIVDPVRRVGG